RGTGGEVTAAPAPFVAPIIARLPLAARPDAEAVDAPVASEAAAQRSPTDAEAAAPPPAGDALTRELLREFRGGRAEPPPPARPAPAPAAQAIRRAPGLDMLRPLAAPAAAPVASAVAEGAAPHLGEALRGPAALGALQGAVESATAEGQGGGQAPALDIDAIAQKVYEHLRRRLRIDQERLGRY
ncbi:MAG TPA: hypothetical protein PKD53_32705, partial [Chloroflexaceae bacterium]|nr:hypothetical protein [Chloroflexaceae bacterium]